MLKKENNLIKINNHTKFLSRPDAILIDIDNTLFPYDEAHNSALDEVKNKMMKMLNINESYFKKKYTSAKSHVKKELIDTASSHSRLIYFQKMMELMNLGSSISLALDFEKTYWRTFMLNMKIFECVKEFFDELRLKNIPLVAITDLTAEIQFKKLIFLELENFFEYVVTSEESGKDKPNKNSFKLAIKKLNITYKLEDQHFWMIGDNLIKDMIGSKEAINATTILKLRKEVKNNNRIYTPDATFTNFFHLKQFVSKL
tara:strand:+ start:1599 stop:2372 length:774 start_codon:yes stop_codon:yes gene_type:complete